MPSISKNLINALGLPNCFRQAVEMSVSGGDERGYNWLHPTPHTRCLRINTDSIKLAFKSPIPER